MEESKLLAFDAGVTGAVCGCSTFRFLAPVNIRHLASALHTMSRTKNKSKVMVADTNFVPSCMRTDIR